VIDPETLEIDADATEAARASIAGAG